MYQFLIVQIDFERIVSIAIPIDVLGLRFIKWEFVNEIVDTISITV